MLLSYLGKGTIISRKNNSIELRFFAKETIIKIVTLLNGNFITPKISAFHKLISWLNLNYSLNIAVLPIED